jgi:hypothetical protein
MTWSIDFKYLNPSQRVQHAEFRPAKVTVTVVGDKKRVTVKCLNVSRDLWTAGGLTFFQNPENGQYDLQPAAPVSDSSSKGGAKAVSEGFELADTAPELFDWAGLGEFSWVKPEMLQGSVKQGTEVFSVYADLPADMIEARQAAASGGVPPQKAGGKAAPAKPVQKWPAGPLGGLPLRPDIKVVEINAQTHYPRFLQVGETLREYTFGVPDVQNLELPPQVARMVKNFGR